MSRRPVDELDKWDRSVRLAKSLNYRTCDERIAPLLQLPPLDDG
jgi:hypothetical protein